MGKKSVGRRAIACSERAASKRELPKKIKKARTQAEIDESTTRIFNQIMFGGGR